MNAQSQVDVLKQWEGNMSFTRNPGRFAGLLYVLTQ